MEILAHEAGNIEKVRVHVLNRVPTRAKPLAFYLDIFSMKKRYFPFDCFTGYKKSNINVLQDLTKYAPLQCFLHAHVSYGVCRLLVCMQQKNLSSLLKCNLKEHLINNNY